jgi:capsid protein
MQEMNLHDQLENFKAEFRMAKTTRFTPRMNGVKTSGSGADFHYPEYQYLHMIERARHYERNDMIVGQGIRRLVANVIQEGFSPNPLTGDPDLNKAYKELWEEYATDPDLCHSEGELNFNQIERLALKSVVRDGDIWCFLRNDGTMQPVEGHRPRSPMRTTKNVVNGVLLDDDAKRKQVWITKEELSYYQLASRVSDLDKFDIRDEFGHRVVLQVYFPDRFSQRRGVSALAPCSDTIGMHDDLQFTTLVKAQMASLIVFLREWDENAMNADNGPSLGTYKTGAQVPAGNGSIKPIGGIQAGLDVTPPKGQTIKPFTANIPNAEFFEHSYLLLTFIAVNLDLPLQVLLLDPQKSTFSSWRGAIDQARIRYREIQSDLIKQFHMNVWKWKCRDWVSQSAALRRMADRQPKTWLKHTWKRPGFPYIEPFKDAQADALQQEKFLNSPRRIMGNKCLEYEEVITEAVEDRMLLIRLAHEKAAELQGKFPDSDITWRDILAASIEAKGSAPAMGDDPNDPNEDEEVADEKTQKEKKKPVRRGA